MGACKPGLLGLFLIHRAFCSMTCMFATLTPYTSLLMYPFTPLIPCEWKLSPSVNTIAWRGTAKQNKHTHKRPQKGKATIRAMDTAGHEPQDSRGVDYAKPGSDTPAACSIVLTGAQGRLGIVEKTLGDVWLFKHHKLSISCSCQWSWPTLPLLCCSIDMCSQKISYQPLK